VKGSHPTNLPGVAMGDRENGERVETVDLWAGDRGANRCSLGHDRSQESRRSDTSNGLRVWRIWRSGRREEIDANGMPTLIYEAIPVVVEVRR
jgi:hypothetical protein